MTGVVWAMGQKRVHDHGGVKMMTPLWLLSVAGGNGRHLACAL